MIVCAATNNAGKLRELRRILTRCGHTVSSLVNNSLTRGYLPAPILNPTTGIQPAAIPTTMEMTIWKNFMTMPTTAMGIWAYCS